MRKRSERVLRGVATSGAIASLLLGAAACGGDSTGEELNSELSAGAPPQPAPPPPTQAPAPTATPPPSGSAAAGGEQRAQLLPLPSSPDANVSGQLTIRNTANGGSVQLTASGLQPSGSYLAMAHTGTCAEQGGPEFTFDPAAGTTPSNTVQLRMQADAQGNGQGNALAPRPLPSRVRSVVLHRAQGEVPVACGELGQPPTS